jgi:hypothetical protein
MVAASQVPEVMVPTVVRLARASISDSRVVSVVASMSWTPKREPMVEKVEEEVRKEEYMVLEEYVNLWRLDQKLVSVRRVEEAVESVFGRQIPFTE